MSLWIAGLAVFALVGVDQLTKLLTVANIPLHGQVGLIPNVLSLTYTQNDGAAFSILQGQQWLFAIIFVLFAGLIIWEFSKKKLPFKPFERWCILFVFAGGLGNMIDRLRLDYVVDMIQTDFMNFPVFNVADCYITCGCIALIVSLIFFNKEFWKEGKKK